MSKILRRVTPTRLRAIEEAGDRIRIVGHAAVYEVASNILGKPGEKQFREIITPGAFAASIAVDDIFALRNHRKDWVLGRSRPGPDDPGTLILAEDEIGLAFDVTLPRATYALDLAESVRRRDLDSCSFGFVDEEETLDPPGPDGLPTIRLERARLVEISLGVPDPAYTETDMSLRSLSLIRAREADAAAVAPPPPLRPHLRALRRRYVSTFPS